MSLPWTGSIESAPVSTSASFAPSPMSTAADEDSRACLDWSKRTIPFKKKDFQHSSSRSSSGKRFAGRNMKQILATESGLAWPDEAITFATIDSPPSFKPAKKYSDISGLEAKYTDPHTKLNYASAEEFKLIRRLPSDIVSGYLALRKAHSQLQ